MSIGMVRAKLVSALGVADFSLDDYKDRSYKGHLESQIAVLKHVAVIIWA
jgi:hypothetical protein